MKTKIHFAFAGLIGATVLLAACTQPLTPKEMATQAKVCRENGLVPVEVHQGYSPMPVAIACHLPEPIEACN